MQARRASKREGGRWKYERQVRSRWSLYVVFFFFQAEDGIRDGTVTGVQTCALPISGGPALSPRTRPRARESSADRQEADRGPAVVFRPRRSRPPPAREGRGRAVAR